MNRRDALKLLTVLPTTARVQTLDAVPGDVIVITFPGSISMETAQRLKTVAEDRFKEFRFMVLDNGGTVSVLRRPR